MLCALVLIALSVSIHAPTRGATCLTSSNQTHMCFNPRPHAGGDDQGFINRVCKRCFNPRPHAGGDDDTAFAPALDKVSIHAPTRGATA